VHDRQTMAPAIPSFIESDCKTKVEYAAWVKTLRGSDASVPAPAAPVAAAGGSVGMMFETDFWTREKGAPLLRRNAGYLPANQPMPDAVAARVAKWPALCGADSPPEPPLEPAPIDEAAARIFLRDAERTFSDEGHRERMMALLARVWPATKDYHQGLGYMASLLMLLFDDETVFRILLRLCREDKYTPGYWHAAPDAYVRDAMVYMRLVAEREPEVAALLQQAGVVPEVRTISLR